MATYMQSPGPFKGADADPGGRQNPEGHGHFIFWSQTQRLCETWFLAALSSSRSLVIRWLVGWSVRLSMMFVKK